MRESEEEQGREREIEAERKRVRKSEGERGRAGAVERLMALCHILQFPLWRKNSHLALWVCVLTLRALCSGSSLAPAWLLVAPAHSGAMKNALLGGFGICVRPLASSLGLWQRSVPTCPSDTNTPANPRFNALLGPLRTPALPSCGCQAVVAVVTVSRVWCDVSQVHGGSAASNQVDPCGIRGRSLSLCERRSAKGRRPLSWEPVRETLVALLGWDEGFSTDGTRRPKVEKAV